ncbi:MAG: PDZ domain-containing protein [Armatimonadetes bacterium]|nr:PDZ domain-containing protein [Armatimonadota bacterium]MBS1728251.1 PDZ domain-containing protein [Armatimonadota bacterium]
MRGLTFSGAVFGALLLGPYACAQLSYTVSDGPDTSKLHVHLEFKANSALTQLQMANWGPGSYRYANNWTRVSAPVMTVGGVDQTVDRVETGTLPKIVNWQVRTHIGDMVTVDYDVNVQFADGIGHYGGPATYMYPVGRTQEPCQLKFAFAKPTPIAIGIEPEVENTSYSIDTFDHLADNPVTYGDYTVDTYTQYGKTHYIAYRGAPAIVAGVDRDYVKKACQFVTMMEGDFFGGSVPYDRYVWHFAVNQGADGAGGLEHLSSTEISMAQGVGPGVVGVYAHEFFHLWNVKRIRSKILGPFDYTTLPQTGALWWLEGVTDYYAHTLLGRYGWYGKNERFDNSIDKMYGTLVQNVVSVRRNANRKIVSPYEASFRVREAANGVGNSQGYLISYYDTGWLCGLCLDIEILDQTKGKYSLDDVEHELYRLCKDNQPGFTEGKIRELVARFGGAESGKLYDQIIMHPGELPVEAQLAKIGLALATVEETYGKTPFLTEASPDDKALKVISSEVPGIKLGDLVTKINGTSFNSSDRRTLLGGFRDLTRNLKPGTKWSVTVISDGETKQVEVEVASATRNSYKVIETSSATPEQKRLRKLFESKKR